MEVLTGEAVGLQNGEGPPHTPPEPRGHRRKCGGTEAAHPIPGRGPPGHGAGGRGRPCHGRVPLFPRGEPGDAFPVAGSWEKGTWGQGPFQPLRAPSLSVCLCMCSKSKPSWLPPRAKMGKKRAGGPRRSPGEVAGPLTTIAAIAARKEGICCAVITAPPLSTFSAGKARRCLPPDPAVPALAAPFLQPLSLPVRFLPCLGRRAERTWGWA